LDIPAAVLNILMSGKIAIYSLKLSALSLMTVRIMWIL
jgi:hypothetical protein